MSDSELPAQAARKPWERQPHDTAKSFAAFRLYRDTKPHLRSLDNLAKEHSASVLRWSAEHDWVRRAAAWDEEADRLQRVAKVEAIRKMNERHVQMAQGMIEKAARRLQALDPNDLSPAELRLYFNDAARLERLAMGEAETSSEVSGKVNIVVSFRDILEGLDGDDDDLPDTPDG